MKKRGFIWHVIVITISLFFIGGITHRIVAAEANEDITIVPLTEKQQLIITTNLNVIDSEFAGELTFLDSQNKIQLKESILFKNKEAIVNLPQNFIFIGKVNVTINSLNQKFEWEKAIQLDFSKPKIEVVYEKNVEKGGSVDIVISNAFDFESYIQQVDILVNNIAIVTDELIGLGKSYSINLDDINQKINAVALSGKWSKDKLQWEIRVKDAFGNVSVKTFEQTNLFEAPKITQIKLFENSKERVPKNDVVYVRDEQLNVKVLLENYATVKSQINKIIVGLKDKSGRLFVHHNHDWQEIADLNEIFLHETNFDFWEDGIAISIAKFPNQFIGELFVGLEDKFQNTVISTNQSIYLVHANEENDKTIVTLQHPGKEVNDIILLKENDNVEFVIQNGVSGIETIRIVQIIYGAVVEEKILNGFQLGADGHEELFEKILIARNVKLKHPVLQKNNQTIDLKMSVTSTAGNINTYEWQYHIDTLTPQIKTGNFTHQTYNNQAVLISFQVDDLFFNENDIVVKNRLSNATIPTFFTKKGSVIQGSVNLRNEGSYELEIVANDLSNNSAERLLNTFFIDNTRPKISYIISGVGHSPYYKSIGNITGIFKDQYLEKFGFKVAYDGVTTIVEGANLTQTHFLNDGKYDIKMFAQDAANNETEVYLDPIIIDSKVDQIVIEGINDESVITPTQQITLKAMDKHVSNVSFRISYFESEQTSENIYVKTDAKNLNEMIDLNSIYDGQIREGLHQIDVQVTDFAGNSDTQQRFFYVAKSGLALKTSSNIAQKSLLINSEKLTNPIIIQLLSWHRQIDEQLIVLKDGKIVDMPLKITVIDNRYQPFQKNIEIHQEALQQEGEFHGNLVAKDIAGNVLIKQSIFAFRNDAQPPKIYVQKRDWDWKYIVQDEYPMTLFRVYKNGKIIIESDNKEKFYSGEISIEQFAPGDHLFFEAIDGNNNQAQYQFVIDYTNNLNNTKQEQVKLNQNEFLMRPDSSLKKEHIQEVLKQNNVLEKKISLEKQNQIDSNQGNGYIEWYHFVSGSILLLLAIIIFFKHFE